MLLNRDEVAAISSAEEHMLWGAGSIASLCFVCFFGYFAYKSGVDDFSWSMLKNPYCIGVLVSLCGALVSAAKICQNEISWRKKNRDY